MGLFQVKRQAVDSPAGCVSRGRDCGVVVSSS